MTPCQSKINQSTLKRGNTRNKKEGPMCDETLPIINKPKHPKKGEYKEQKRRINIQEKKNNLRK